MADISILDSSTAAAPKSYTVKGAQEIILRSVTGSYDGTGAAGSYIPAVQILDPAGFVVGTFVANTTLAAGASADVSWFPSVGGGGGSSGGGGLRRVRIPLTTPDSSGNGYAALTITSASFSNVRGVLPAFTKSVDGTWEGAVTIPDDYASGGVVTLYWAANATTGNLRNRVGTSVVANSVSLDTAYTQETYVNTTCAGTARQRFSSSFTLSTTLVAASTLLVQVTRNGTSGSDTLAVDALLFLADLTYTSSY